MRTAMATSADLLHVTMMKTEMMVAEEDPHHVTVIMKMAIGADPHHVTRMRTKKADAGEDPAPLDSHPEINARIVRDYKCHKPGQISLNIVIYQSTFTVCFLFYKHDNKFCKHKCSAKFLLLNHYYLLVIRA